MLTNQHTVKIQLFLTMEQVDLFKPKANNAYHKKNKLILARAKAGYFKVVSTPQK